MQDERMLVLRKEIFGLSVPLNYYEMKNLNISLCVFKQIQQDRCW